MSEDSENVDTGRNADGLDVYWVRTDAAQASWLGLAIYDRDHATMFILRWGGG